MTGIGSMGGQLSISEFGPFQLDPGERLLLRDGQPVALTPKAFDLLLYLVDRPGRLVEKQAVMSALWPDAIVEEGNLASTVSALRKALGPEGDEQRAIATVPTRGYRFVMPVARVEGRQASEATPRAPDAPAGSRSHLSRRIAGLALLSAVMLGVGWILAGRTTHSQASLPLTFLRLPIEPADGIRGPDLHGEQWGGRNRPTRTAIALSPDGRRLVFTGLRGDQQQLWVKPLDGPDALPVAGAEQAAAPFFSPDGRWVGYWSNGALWKVPAAGGVPIKICAARLSFGASWGTDDTIVFADEFAGGLRRVAAAGGVPKTLTTLSKGEGSHRFPQFLPGARAVVFTIVAIPNEPRLGTSVVLLSLDTGKQRILFRDAADARYVSTGHLVYVAGGNLMAAPFDLNTLHVTGDPVGLPPGPVMQSNTTAAEFTVSDSGTLAWLPAAVDPNPEKFRTIVWVDRRGRSTSVGAAPDTYYAPRLSPNRLDIAVQTTDPIGSVWIYHTRSGVRERVPFDGFASAPLWTPEDGKRLVFRGAREGNPNLYWIPVDGSSPAERLTNSPLDQFPASWTPDGRVLVFLQCESQCDIWALSVDGPEKKVWPVVQTPAQEKYPTLSPDGKWLAYMSSASGRDEVWVQPFPEAGERHQISTEGGTWPRWSPDGRGLYYCAPVRTPWVDVGGTQLLNLPLPARTGHTYLVVDVSTHPAFSASPARVVFEDPEMKYTAVLGVAGYDVAPDGRFLMVEVKRGSGMVPPPPADVRMIVNWSRTLRERVPAR